MERAATVREWFSEVNRSLTLPAPSKLDHGRRPQGPAGTGGNRRPPQASKTQAAAGPVVAGGVIVSDTSKEAAAMRQTPPSRFARPTRRAVLALFAGAAAVACLWPAASRRLAAADGPATGPATAPPVVIRGRVVDDKGQAVAGATVRAGVPAMGQVLWWAQTGAGVGAAVRSGPDGRFEAPVPFAGLLYDVGVERIGYDAPSIRVIAGEGGPVEVRLTKGLHKRWLGKLHDVHGKPVPAADVRLVGEYGYSVVARTRADGTFQFDDVPEYVGQAVMVAKANDLVLPLAIVRNRDPGKDPLDLWLDLPGRIVGRLTDEATGGPVAGATVTVRPNFGSGLRLTATSDAAGAWAVDDVPPGAYWVEPSSPTHFDKPPGGMGFNRKEVRVGPGGSARLAVRMRRTATVRGRVLGPDGRPAAGALVGLPATWDGDDYREQVRTVRAGPDGRYEIATGHVEEDLAVAAFSADLGLAHVSIAPVAAGEAREGVDLALPGAVRVRGTVAGRGGRPVADVACATTVQNLVAVTGADGRFDLGRVSLEPGLKVRPAVTFTAPRPGADFRSGWIMYPASRDGAPDTQPAGPPAGRDWYRDRTVPFDVAPGRRDVGLDVALEPTDVVTVAGRAVDAGGEPVPGAAVYLFAGDAGDETWVEMVRPRLGGGSIMTHTDKMLTGGRADKAGRFRLFTLRSDAGAEADGAAYSVGVLADGHGPRLVKGVVVAAGQAELELTVSVDDDVKAAPATPTTQPR